ncbi:hypothetical protein YC2023_109294 [Brassica napus]
MIVSKRCQPLATAKTAFAGVSGKTRQALNSYKPIRTKKDPSPIPKLISEMKKLRQKRSSDGDGNVMATATRRRRDRATLTAMRSSAFSLTKQTRSRLETSKR